MQELSEIEMIPAKKKHFIKLHEKIQTKYMEMQKRLEKSRSVDSLSIASDDFNYKESRYSSNCDLRESDEVSVNLDVVYKVEEQPIIEEKIIQNAVLQAVEGIDIRFSDGEISIFKENNITDEDWEKVEPDEYVDSRASLESLNEISKYNDDSLIAREPPSRTIKDRIGSRISAVKEKREQKRLEKERQLKEKQLKEARDSIEKVEKFILSNSAKDIPQTKTNRKNKLATVTLALINATVDERLRFLQCRFRLGAEKYKSKLVKSNSPTVNWQELFNLNMYEEKAMLETTLWDKDTFLGRNYMDLSELEKEKTHKLKIDLEGDNNIVSAKVFMLLTISGIPLLNVVTETDDVNKIQKALEVKKDAWNNVENDIFNVGWLSVVIYGAKGLYAQDCYCMLKLVNERVQTHTEYKTNDPSWMKIFTFQLTDITSILEISVVEEKKGEEIGKISIPLLRIRDGAKVWYALKDQTQRERAKGNNPRILLEMGTSWHLARAALRVINPKEPDLLDGNVKLDRRLFARNITRARAVTKWTLDTLKLIKTCFEWESRRSNVVALTIWIIFCYFFKIWMLPLLFLIPFVKYRPEKYYLVNWKKLLTEPNNGALEYAKIEKEEKSSLRQKINNLQEILQTLQSGIGKLASIGESVKNLCNFTVPFVSLLAVGIILLTSLIMYIIPLKYILICYGIHKFTRKILRPNRIPNNEILDLLSRVPDDETLLDCEELLLENISDEDSIL
ncbi:unnamed protein product [Chilo suppressalis]|uniref:C2 domain-containing protein n=1 Tax=Chilo suppressalis TaxID=168631 RepID=A0ABN8ASA1_CHISP|nr:unnamed protein product [Chilo suppressalis]